MGLAQRLVELQAGLVGEGAALALGAVAEAAVVQGDGEHELRLPAGERLRERGRVLVEGRRDADERREVVDPAVAHEVTGGLGAGAGRAHVGAQGIGIGERPGLGGRRSGVTLGVDVDRTVTGEEHPERLAGSCDGGARGGELRLGRGDFLGGAHLVDAVAQAADEAGVGEVAVGAGRLQGAGERVEGAALGEHGEPRAGGGGCDLPARLLRGGAGGADVVGGVRPRGPPLRNHQRNGERDVARELVGAGDDPVVEHAITVEAGVDGVDGERGERGRAGLRDERLGAAHLGLCDGCADVAGDRAGDGGAEGEAGRRGGLVGGGLRGERRRGEQQGEGGEGGRSRRVWHARGSGYSPRPLTSQSLWNQSIDDQA